MGRSGEGAVSPTQVFQMNMSLQAAQTNTPNESIDRFSSLRVFTEIEAAKVLKVSRVTLQRVRLSGGISFSRVGSSRVVYTEKNLTDYLAARERKSTVI